MTKIVYFCRKELLMMSDIRQLQIKCLEIFDFVDKICIEHNIQYSLCGGTVVGAHLYKGFLPWDDDIDLMMTRDNYNKFLKIINNNIPKGFSIINYQNSDYSTTLKICFSKIINENTTYVSKNGDIMGIFLDITVYDKVPNGPLKYIDLFLCERILTINKGKTSEKGFRNCIRNLIFDAFLSNRRKYLCFFQVIAEFLGKISSHYTYRELFGAYHYYNMLPYTPAIFENYTTISFEGRTAMIVRDYIKYLETRYNRTDFHEPIEKQIPLHYEHIDLNLPYKEYLAEKNNKNLKDSI